MNEKPLSYQEIIKRLTWIANAKPGQSLPDWLGGNSNNWGPPLSHLAKETLSLIANLEESVDDA